MADNPMSWWHGNTIRCEGCGLLFPMLDDVDQVVTVQGRPCCWHQGFLGPVTEQETQERKTGVITDGMLDAALDAFRIGPPGVIRRVELIDSYPGEHKGDPDAYNRLPCTRADELAAMRDAITAALEAR